MSQSSIKRKKYPPNDGTFLGCEEWFNNKSEAIAVKLFEGHLLGHKANIARLKQQQGGAGPSAAAGAQGLKPEKVK